MIRGWVSCTLCENEIDNPCMWIRELNFSMHCYGRENLDVVQSENKVRKKRMKI